MTNMAAMSNEEFTDFLLADLETAPRRAFAQGGAPEWETWFNLNTILAVLRGEDYPQVGSGYHPFDRVFDPAKATGKDAALYREGVARLWKHTGHLRPTDLRAITTRLASARRHR